MDIGLVRNASPPCDLHVSGSNRLLTLLQATGDAGAILRMDRVSLARRTPLIEPYAPITHVYFPLTGVASLIIDMEDGPGLEIGTTGNEGMVGVPLVLGTDRSQTRVFVQVEGEFMRMPSAAFTVEFARNGAFADLTRRYAQGLFGQVAQSSACLRFHAVEQRLCRWILTTQDRVGEQTLPLTQEFLALMLGVQRPSVSLAATTLQKAGLIRYRRGVIEVLDREGLEAASCACYRVVRREFERLLC